MTFFRQALIAFLAFGRSLLEQAKRVLSGWLQKLQPEFFADGENLDSRSLVRRAINAREEERRRIARELHDGTSQLITALRLSLETLSLTTTPELAEQLDKPLNLSRQADDEIDKLIHDLRPALINEVGLFEAIRAQAETRLEETGIAVNFALKGPESRLPDETEVALYRVMQEGINNIIKHAGASNVSIQLSFNRNKLIAEIDDDGCGFDSKLAETGGLGLIGMKERIGLIGGRLSIASAPGLGTRLKITLPLAPERVKV